MKKFYILLCLFVIACATPEPVTQDKLNLAEQLVDIQFSMDKIDPIIGRLAEDLTNDFRKKVSFLYYDEGHKKLGEYAIKDMVARYTSPQILKVQMAEYYAQEYSTKEMQQLIEFLSSSAGRKLTAILNKLIEDTDVEMVSQKSLLGKETKKAKTTYKKDLKEYDKEFMDSLTDEERQQYMSFAMGGLGGKYKVTMNRFWKYAGSKMKNIDYEKEYRKSMDNMVAQYGKDYFGIK